MKPFVPSTLLLLVLASVGAAQSAPSIVWSAPTPGLLANDVAAVAWSPTDDGLAVGSSDRWFRLRVASTGMLLYSILEPKNSGGPGDIIYSGTPENVGPVVRGDLIEIHIDRLPELSVRIV